MNELRGQRASALRKADWRFLLGNTTWKNPLVLGSGPDAMSLRNLLGTALPGGEDKASQHDVVVAVDPDDSTLQAVVRGLEGGATAGIQFRFGRVGTVIARLDRAGLETIAAYTGWPVRHPRRWLPLGDPVADAWLATAASGAITKHPRRWLRWFIWRARRRAGLLPLAVLATGRTEARDGRPKTLPVLTNAAPLGELVMAAKRAIGLQDGDGPVVLISSGDRTWSKVVMLVLDGAAANPNIVVKVARAPDQTAGLRHEASILRSLAALGFHGGQEIPVALADREMDQGGYALAESALLGISRSLSPRSSDPVIRETLERGADWLATLAERTAATAQRVQRVAAARDIFDRLALDFRDVIDFDERRRAQLAETLSPLPSVVEHRDFAPWNLLWPSTGGLGVTDWECTATDGWPATDLIYFSTYTAFAAASARTPAECLRAYIESKDAATQYGDLARRVMAEYFRRLSLDMSVLPVLRSLTWAIHARSEFERAVDDYGPHPPPGVLSRGLLLQLWLEEDRSLR